MKILVISSGQIKDYSELIQLTNSSDYIICADGGLDHLLKIKEKPDIVVGDLDSITTEGIKYIHDNSIETMKFPARKNMTDTELAVDLAISKKATCITLVGVTGSRIDHSLANILLLRHIKNVGIDCRIIDNNNVVYYTKDKLKINKKEDSYLSVVPLTLDGAIVTLKNVAYPLDKHLIEYGSTLGISNEIEDEFADIQIHKGEVLVIVSKD